jgi:hypothetical protein
VSWRLKPLKARFWKSYKIGVANQEAKWEAYKVHVLGEARTDEELSSADIARLNGTIVDHERRLKI